jgi:hypothetical protein
MFLVHPIEVAQDIINICQEERIRTGGDEVLLELMRPEFGEKFG